MLHPQTQQAVESLDEHLDYATRYAERKANQLVGHFGYGEFDHDDIVQELLLDLVRRWPKFDPGRGRPQVFIRRVIWARVSTLIREKRAAKRGFDYEAAPMDDDAEETTTNFRTGLPRRNDQEFSALATDVATVLDGLPDDLRDLCQRLQSQTLSAISRELNVPRNTLADRVKRLRRVFEDAGLHHYLQPESR